MSTTWSDSKTVHHHPPVDIRFGLPKYMEKCLTISIAAGNSAGMSSPTIFTVRCQATLSHSTATTVVKVTSTTTNGPTSTDLVDQIPQGDYSKIYIATAVGAVAIVATGALILIILWRRKRPTNVKSERSFHQPDLGPEYSTLPCFRVSM